ncbi:hypothetical protein I4U23_017063 [Adineta vaga]|nr:hypothetical protein I4U23_017063 [Adineta vaga]
MDYNNSAPGLKVISIWKLRFFIKDLHEALIREQNSNPVSAAKLYRGQIVPKIILEQIKRSIGGLIAFYSFLSTTSSEDVARSFIQGIDENDISLVVRIEGMKQFDDGIWNIQLKMTTDDDPQLQQLGNYIRQFDDAMQIACENLRSIADEYMILPSQTLSDFQNFIPTTSLSRKQQRYIPYHLLGDKTCSVGSACESRHLGHIFIFHFQGYNPQPRHFDIDPEKNKKIFTLVSIKLIQVQLF